MELLHQFLHVSLFNLAGTPVTPLSLLALLLTLAIAALLGRGARQATTRMLMRRGEGREGVAYALGRMAQYSVFVLGLFLGLENVGVSLKSLAAFSAVLMVGIGFGLQNIAQNFISGLILLIERPVQKGDFINVGDTAGTVEDIAMRATRILTTSGVQIIVPNSELITSRVVNRSAPTSTARVGVTVGVAYGTDTDLVRETLLGVARANAHVQVAPPPQVYFRDFGESALQFELTVWIGVPQSESSITSELRFAIDRAFRAASIEIPFPQREVCIKDGGGNGAAHLGRGGT